MVKNVKSNKPYEWLILPQTYFLSAKILCDKLEKEMQKEVFGGGDFKEKYDYRQSIEHFIRPVIFNFKHGIELYLKGIGNICDATYPVNHDLINLLNILIKKITKRKRSERRGEILKKLDVDIRKIIEKYYFGLYIPTIKYKIFPDNNNIAERYPEDNKKEVYEIPDLFYFKNNKGDSECWVTEKLLLEIRKDIDKIYKLFEEIAPDINFNRV